MIETNPTSTAAFGLGPGHIANNLGALIEIIECVPTVVTFRPTEKCYMDLPVSWRGQSRFRDPKSHTLKKESSPVSCRNECPYHEIGDRYFQACPNLKAISNITVEILDPNKYEDHRYKMEFFTMGNIFGSKARLMIKSILMHVTRKVMTNIWAGDMVHARGSGGDDDGNGRGSDWTVSYWWNLATSNISTILDKLAELTMMVEAYCVLFVIGVALLIWGLGVLNATLCRRKNKGPSGLDVIAMPFFGILRLFIRIWTAVGLPDLLPQRFNIFSKKEAKTERGISLKIVNRVSPRHDSESIDD